MLRLKTAEVKPLPAHPVVEGGEAVVTEVEQAVLAEGRTPGPHYCLPLTRPLTSPGSKADGGNGRHPRLQIVIPALNPDLLKTSSDKVNRNHYVNMRNKPQTDFNSAQRK